MHRDLKPQNIFLCRAGARDDVVKVVDFGMSKMLGAQSLLTGSQTLIGTPAHMSPEQADQRPDAVDLRSDVYSMASLGEVRPAPPRPRRRAVVVAGAGVLIAGLVGALFPTRRREEPRGALGPGEPRPAVQAAPALSAPSAPKDAGDAVAPTTDATQRHVAAARVPGASKVTLKLKKDRRRATSSASVARQKQRQPKDRPREKRPVGDGIVGFD